MSFDCMVTPYLSAFYFYFVISTQFSCENSVVVGEVNPPTFIHNKMELRHRGAATELDDTAPFSA